MAVEQTSPALIEPGDFRSNLAVTWRDGGYLYNVTIESPSEGEKVQCCVAKSALSESFLGLLADAYCDQAAAS